MRKIKDQIDELQKEIKQYKNLSEDEQAKLREYYINMLTYSSNAIEGSTLTLQETTQLLTNGITPAGKPVIDTLYALGYRDALEYITTQRSKRIITENHVFELHKRLMGYVDKEHAGVYRTEKIFNMNSSYPPADPEKIPKLMENLFKHLQKERLSTHPVTFAAKLHKKFSYIRPFDDGNGRMSRLLMTLALVQSGFPPLVIDPSTRNVYLTKLEKARKTPYIFADFIATQVLKSQEEFLRLLK